MYVHKAVKTKREREKDDKIPKWEKSQSHQLFYDIVMYYIISIRKGK